MTTPRRRVKARSVADMLGVTARTVANLAVSGALPSAAKIGKVWTFDPAAIEGFIARQEERTREEAWDGTDPGTAQAVSRCARRVKYDMLQ